jgi:hypothetical protein
VQTITVIVTKNEPKYRTIVLIFKNQEKPARTGKLASSFITLSNQDITST